MATSKHSKTGSIWASAAGASAVIDPDSTSDGKFEAGWGEEIPPYEWFNFLQQMVTQQLAYINEQGVSEWDNTTTYPIHAFVKGSDGELYKAVVENVNTNPVTDSGVNWRPAVVSGKVRIVSTFNIPSDYPSTQAALNDFVAKYTTDSQITLNYETGFTFNENVVLPDRCNFSHVRITSDDATVPVNAAVTDMFTYGNNSIGPVFACMYTNLAAVNFITHTGVDAKGGIDVVVESGAGCVSGGAFNSGDINVYGDATLGDAGAVSFIPLTRLQRSNLQLQGASVGQVRCVDSDVNLNSANIKTHKAVGLNEIETNLFHGCDVDIMGITVDMYAENLTEGFYLNRYVLSFWYCTVVHNGGEGSGYSNTLKPAATINRTYVTDGTGNSSGVSFTNCITSDGYSDGTGSWPDV